MERFPHLLTTESGKQLGNRLEDLRTHVLKLLSSNLQPELTDHSVKHSDDLVCLINLLTTPLQTGKHALNEQELFVLYAACYLHDIGMQYEKADNTEVIQSLNLPIPLAEMDREERGSYLRQYHNRISAELVKLSRNTASPPIGFQLRNDDNPQFIASLCEAHTLWMDGKERDRYELLMKAEGSNVRMPLLSGLLRMADILDESKSRVDRSLADTRLLPVLSEAHWYRHFYTDHIDVNPSENKITIRFVFPPTRREAYETIVPHLSVPEIREEYGRHGAVFSKYGVVWYIQPVFDQNPYTEVEEMPDEVELEMLAILNAREVAAARQRRQAMLGEFERAQPIIARMMKDIDQLPANVPAKQRLKKLRIAAERFNRIGARHSEISILQSLFSLLGQTDQTREKLDVGLRLAQMRYDQELTRQGLEVALECVQIAEALPAPLQQRLSAARLKARGYGTLFTSDTEEAYETAIALAVTAKSPADVNALTSERSEFELLTGNLDKIASVAVSKMLTTDIASSSPGASHIFNIRVEAVVAYAMAVHGQVDEAVQRLQKLSDALVSKQNTLHERIHLLNTKAYILYLAGRPKEASETMQVLCESVTLRDQPELKLVIERNKAMCDLMDMNLAGLSENLRRDAKALVGVSEGDAVSPLDALPDLLKGQHIAALAGFWKELKLAYAVGDWFRFQHAAEYLAEAFLNMGNLPAATYYAVEGGCAVTPQ